MIYGCTGHRPKRLTVGGLVPYSTKQNQVLTTFAVSCFSRLGSENVYVRMALGWDQACARACTYLGIPWQAVIPCANYESTWPEATQREYKSLLEKASGIVQVSNEPYTPARLELADRWMVQQIDALLALYDSEPKGGTAKCVTYALEKHVHVVNVWEDFLRTQMMKHEVNS
jgi:uncharacterized phage-like protein YoqJ